MSKRYAFIKKYLNRLKYFDIYLDFIFHSREKSYFCLYFSKEKIELLIHG